MAVVERRIRVILEDNAAQFEQHMKGAAGATQQFGDHAGKVEQATGLAGRGMAGMSSITQQAVASFLGFASAQGVMNLMSMAVNVTKDTVLGFNDAMTQSTAIMGDVSDATKNALGATARQVAVDYNTAVEDVAKGYYYLISAGYDVQSSQLAIGQVTAFAKAGMFDLERATELAADAQNAMGLKSDDATENLKQLTRVTDVLTKANIDANGSVEQFAEALTNKAAGASRLAGISLEETVGVLEAFAAQGVKGKRAGEDYAIVLRDLSTFSRTNADAFRALGITVYDNQGKFAGWSTIIGQVEHALTGMSAEQKNATLATLGLGAESSAYLQVLLGTSAAIDSYTSGVKNAGGATQEVAQRQMQSMVEQLKHIRAEAAELGLKAFDGLMKAGEWVASTFGPAIRDLATGFGYAADAVAPLVGLVAQVAGGAAVGALAGLGNAMGAIGRLAADNEEAIRLLATVGFVALAAQVTATAYSYAELAKAQLAVRAMDVSAAIRSAAESFALARANGAGFMSALQGATGALGGLSAASLLAGGTIAALGAILYVVQKGENDGAEAARRFHDEVERKFDTSSYDGLNKAIDEYRHKVEDLGHYGSTIGDRLNVWQYINKEGEYNTAKSQLTEYQERMNKFNSVLDDTARHLQDQAPAAQQGAGGLQQIRDRLVEIQAAGKIDLTAPGAAERLMNVYQGAESASPAIETLAQSADTMSSSISSATDKAKALNDALDALIGIPVSAAQALDQFAGSLDKVAQSAGSVTDWMDAYGEKNRQGRDDALASVDAALKVAEANYKNGESLAQVGQDLEGMRGRLIETMVQHGANREAAQRFIDTLNLTPERVKTVVEADTAKAQADVGNVQLRMWDVRTGAHTVVTVDAVQAMMALQGVQAQLSAINNRVVMARVQMAPPQMPLAAGGVLAPYAEGGIRRFAYGSGHEDHVAQIAPGGAMRLWAEPETGGEAYIPLAGSKRGRSSAILGDVADMFGYQLVPKGGDGFQPGSVSAPVMAMSGGRSVNAPITVVVNADVNASGGAVAKAAVSAITPVLRSFARDLQTEIRTRG